jgi:hypothetical protein
VILADKVLQCQALLMQIADALNLVCLGFGTGKGRQKQSG